MSYDVLFRIEFKSKSLQNMTSLDGHIFHVTDPLWGESTCHRWISLTKANDAVL